jgi:enoyl-CoA hydratase/carnithine racemase
MIGECLDAMEADDGIRAIIIASSSDKVFSAGFDFSDSQHLLSSEDVDDQTSRSSALCKKIWYLDKPVITAVRGHAIAFGCLLALISDITVASDDSKFSEPEIRHGTLTPMILLPWLTHMKALHEFYYTGDVLTGEQALALGLVNRVVDNNAVEAEARRIANRIALAPRYAIKSAKRAIRQAYDMAGFANAQNAHRYIDTYLIDSHGDPRRDELKRIRQEQGVKAFVEARDGPYSK